MSTVDQPHRRGVRGCGLVGVGVTLLSLAMASPARAADGAVVLETGVVTAVAFPAENTGGVLRPSPHPLDGTYTPVHVEYGDTLTVELPSEVRGVGPHVLLSFDDDGDGTVEKAYSTRSGVGDPLLVTGLGTSTLSITLPADDGVSGASAWLSVYPGHADRGSETDVHSTEYLLEFGSAALDPVTLRPPLVVAGYHYCAAPADCVVRAGTSLTVALPVSTGLQSFGVTDLTGFAVALEPSDWSRVFTGDGVELTAQPSADGRATTITVPAGTATGDHRLVLWRPHGSGISYLFTDVTVLPAPPAAVAPVVVPPAAAAPSAQAVVNPGLRSGTGVPAPAEDPGSGVVAAGAALLLLAGAGGVAVARTRRRGVEAGTGGV